MTNIADNISGQAAELHIVTQGRDCSPSKPLALSGKNVPSKNRARPKADSLGFTRRAIPTKRDSRR